MPFFLTYFFVVEKKNGIKISGWIFWLSGGDCNWLFMNVTNKGVYEKFNYNFILKL